MLVYSTRPVEMETPIELLREHKLTPKEILYIRTNQVHEECNHLKAMPLQGQIEILGLVTVPYALEVSQLSGMPQAEVHMVLQCSGNGRAFFSRKGSASGVQWTRGGGGCVKFKGVPLKLILERAQVSPNAKFITAEGLDKPEVPTASDFEKSMPLADVIDTAILAVEMNGEPIPAVHGGPVRLVLPGFYGVNNVKWLKRLRLEAVETPNVAQRDRYRSPNMLINPGDSFTYTSENSTPNWQQRIKSIIWSPLQDQKVSDSIVVSGAAWNDGKAPITSIMVSIDAGQNWQKADVEVPPSPYAWYLWQINLKAKSKGTLEVWSMATDALGRSQPIDGTLFWNPKGYEWNGVDKVKVTVA
jgi:DMSO/TMAO reductase YedYZ molybdopterin-dependent catalytic subunit